AAAHRGAGHRVDRRRRRVDVVAVPQAGDAEGRGGQRHQVAGLGQVGLGEDHRRIRQDTGQEAAAPDQGRRGRGRGPRGRGGGRRPRGGGRGPCRGRGGGGRRRPCGRRGRGGRVRRRGRRRGGRG